MTTEQKNDATKPNFSQVEVFLSSADWMERNLHHRVEIAFPVLEVKSQKRIYRNLQFALKDESAWVLQMNGSYKRVEENYNPETTLQSELIRTHGS